MIRSMITPDAREASLDGMQSNAKFAAALDASNEKLQQRKRAIDASRQKVGTTPVLYSIRAKFSFLFLGALCISTVRCDTMFKCSEDLQGRSRF